MSESIRSDSIIFLFGAGASKEAGIKITSEMISEIENTLIQDTWSKYKDLYYYLKSAILFSKGLKGNFSKYLNIEELMIVISDLVRSEENTLYPFIANWNFKFLELAGEGFINLKAFESEIRKRLFNSWISITSYSKASYFKKFIEFQNEYEFPLEIFSLNYDMCFENAIGDLSIETGFDDMKWVGTTFKDNNSEKKFHLYKLHGSINWYNDEGTCTKADGPISDEDYQKVMIFGEKMKLQPIDPYFFMVSEFRNKLENALLLICIGYSFGDDYINKIIEQSSHKNQEIIILDVSNTGDKEENINERKSIIKNAINIKEERININTLSAKKFIEDDLDLPKLKEIIYNDIEF